MTTILTRHPSNLSWPASSPILQNQSKSIIINPEIRVIRRASHRGRRTMETTWKAGLEDVIAARSAITAIDGAQGRLYHRGYEIGELAAHTSFEETTHLLWFGELPSAPEA